MCEEIVRLAGISDYTVNKFPDDEEGDLAILLSESKTKMNSLAIKINTSSQIFESIKEVSKISGNELSDEEVLTFFNDYELSKKYLVSDFKRDINVKVYSEFLKDIVRDVGFNIVCENFDYVIYLFTYCSFTKFLTRQSRRVRNPHPFATFIFKVVSNSS